MTYFTIYYAYSYIYKYMYLLLKSVFVLISKTFLCRRNLFISLKDSAILIYKSKIES